MNRNVKAKNSDATDLSREGLQNIGSFGSMPAAVLKAWSEVGGEALKFISLRMQQDVAAQRAMLNCRSLEDVRKVQIDFFGKALADYKAEATHMMKIMSGAMTQGQTDAIPSAKREYDDVPL